jgi:vitamin K-dependent gamma-carboxylase
MSVVTSFFTRLQKRAFEPVDIASLVFFRIAFGLLMILEVGRYFVHHWIATQWLEPRFLFKYYGFEWIRPWPGIGLYIHWAALGVFALLIAIGFLYRISAAFFFVSYTYFFLLDEARYVNHTYLICLFSFLLIFVPANRAFSVDALLRPRLHSESVPAWGLWLLRAQMGMVYFFAGVAKIAPDWLRGEPMRTRMAKSTDFPILGRFFREEWAVYGASYGSLLLDLCIFPLLLWRRTRVAAFCMAVAFHLINARWFPLGIFPWLAIAGTMLFLSPSWPRKITGLFRRGTAFHSRENYRLPSSRAQSVILSCVGLYLSFQLIIPLRHFLSRGGIEWNCAEHRFSWRMMLVRQYTRAIFYVTDPNVGKTTQVNPRAFLDSRQTAMLAYLPDFPLQFAHYLAKVMPRRGPKPLKVEARIFLGVNSRKPELYIDPNVDLGAEPRPFLLRPRWLLPIKEPLPSKESR